MVGKEVLVSFPLAGLVIAVAPVLVLVPAQGICPPQPVEIVGPFAGNGFSSGLALDGDTFAASPWSGEVVAIYRRDLGGPGAWGLQYTLNPPTVSGGFGVGDLDQFTLAIWEDVSSGGAKDAVLVYERNPGGDDWELTKTLAMDPGEIELQGDTLVVGQGVFVVGVQPEVQVLDRNQGGPNQWGHVATLVAPSSTALLFGNSMSLSGDTLAVGDDMDNSPKPLSGSVTVFERSGGTWQTVKVLYQPNGIGGQNFGRDVALEGDTLLVGADNAKVNGVKAGTVFVFSRDLGGPDNWGLLTEITASDPADGAHFGLAVALSGDLALIGSPSYPIPGCANIGQAYLVQRDRGGSDNWGEVAVIPSHLACLGDFGRTVALDGGTALVGVPDVGPANMTGSVVVYEDVIASCPMTYCTPGTSASGCQAVLDASGTSSASAASGFSLSAAGVEGQKDGLFFFGTNGQQANPWGNGTSFQCVVPPVVRAPVMAGSGAVGLCDGSFALDLNALWCPSCSKPAKNPGAAAVVQAQLWYRDPLSTSNQTTSLSDAIEFVVGL